MRRRDLIDLVLLAALWGASFLFTRVAVPAFGALAALNLSARNLLPRQKLLPPIGSWPQ